MSKYKVVIVEDHYDLVNEIERHLRNHPDIELVEKYYDVESAVEEMHLYNVDLVILDISFTGSSKNGIDCLVSLRSKAMAINRGVRFLMYTQSDEDVNLLSALALGADGYVLKSDSVAKIPLFVKMIMKGEGVMTPRMVRKLIEYHREHTREKPQAFVDLSDQEKTIVKLVSEGLSNIEVADRMSRSDGYIRQILVRVFVKLEVKNRYRLILLYWKITGRLR